MRTQYQYIMGWLLLLTGMLYPLRNQAQTTPRDQLGILELQGTDRLVYFNTQSDLSDLLTSDTQGEAMIEFWIDAEGGTRGWEVGDLLANDQHFSMRVANQQLSLHIGNETTKKPLSLNPEWNHFALVFKGGELEIFLNGIPQGKSPAQTITGNTGLQRNLYFRKHSNTNTLKITEVRTWSKARETGVINAQRFEAYPLKSAPELKNLHDNGGLQLVLGGNTSEDETHSTLTELTYLRWPNILREKNTALPVVETGRGIAAYKNTIIARVNTGSEHPILDNTHIFLYASKGEFESKVELEWLVLKDGAEYRVFKDNRLLGRVRKEDSEDSFYLSYIDEKVVPGEFYTYRVEVFDADGNVLTTTQDDRTIEVFDQDGGFITYNGLVSGNIKTQSDIFVQGVKVTASPESGRPLGSALRLAPEKSHILISNIKDLTKISETMLLEFWYKSEENGSTDNALLEMDGLQIQAGTAMRVNYGQNKEISIAIEDREWHHYAILLGSKGAQLYKDGASKENNPTTFTTEWKTRKIEIAGSIQQEALLDELRIWDIDRLEVNGEMETDEDYQARIDRQIARNYDIQLSGGESGLLLYFRFDEGQGSIVYDVARNADGRIRGEAPQVSEAVKDANGKFIPIEWVAEDELPKVYPGAYTDAGGNYSIGAINYAEATNFFVTPALTNYAFAPENQKVYLQRSLQKREYTKEDIDFTDISSLPIAGRVYYQTDPSETFATFQECNTCFPVPKGQQIMIDGIVAASASEDAQTDLTGLYSVSAPLGKHRIQVNNPAQQQSFGTQSVKFDGETGYLQGDNWIRFDQNWMLSGWIRPDEEISPVQTILDLGNIRLVLKNNQTLEVQQEDATLLTSTIQLTSAQSQSEFTFFTLVYDRTRGKFGLYVDNTYDEAPSGDTPVVEPLVVGAKMSEGTASDFFKGNIDQLEYRTALYLRTKEGEPTDHQELLENLKEGKLISSGNPAIQSNIQGLHWSYTFEHSAGRRAVAFDKDNNYFLTLDLYGGVDWDAVGTPYTREFQYAYEAGNAQFNPEGDAYDLNITQAFTELHFENKTRFGFTGNIVIPCGFNAGEWTGTITRTDVVDPKFEKTIDESNFEKENTLFVVSDLLPGSYRVSLTNVADPARKIQSPVIDIAKGWAHHDFEFRNPLNISAQLYKPSLDSLAAEELYPICVDDISYELVAGEQYLLEVTAYELYGDGEDIEANRCYVGDATVSIGGDAAIVAERAHNTATGDDPQTEVQEEKGKVNIPFMANSPNFLADFTRKLKISVNHDGRNQQAEISAYNTGSRQEEKNFTIKSPRVVSVLHDPPGGESTAHLEKGHEIVFTTGHEAGFEQEFSIAGEVGIDTDNYAGGGLGAIFIQKTSDVETGLTIGAIQKSNFKKINNDVYSVSFDRTIQTSSDPGLVGLDADVYVGMGQVIHLGRGKTLSIDTTCTVKFEDNVEVGKTEVESMFAYTHQDIKDVLIPQLEIAVEAESDSTEKVELQRQVRAWSKILENNVNTVKDIVNHDNWKAEQTLSINPLTGEPVGIDATNLGDGALLNGEISFSGGVEVAYDFAMSHENLEGVESGGGAGVTQKFETSVAVFGVDIGVEQNFQMLGFRNNNRSTGDANSTTMGFTLYDGDNGDHFNVAVKKDPVYSTPIFKTLAGQSMCPYEAGTQPREGVELTVEGAEDVHALYGEEAVFHLTLKNTQVATDNTPKQYFIAVDRANVPDGAIVRYNGDPMGNGLTIDFMANETIKHGVVTISHPDFAQGGQLDYEDIPILLYSGCERDGFLYSSYHIDELKEANCGSLPFRNRYINPDGTIDEARKAEFDNLVETWQNCNNHTKMVDEVKLSAHFRAPCVTEIQMKQPGNGWIVNKTSNNQLELVFAIPGLTSNTVPGGLNKLHIERFDKNSPTQPLLLETLKAEDLSALVQTDGNAHYVLDVNGLADGDYQIRLTPQCGNDSDTEPWRRQNPTEWLEGNIFRSIPVITSITPGDGGVLGEDKTVTITYDRPIQYTGVSSANISLRGVLSGDAYTPKSGIFTPATQVTIPHHGALSLDSAYLVEFWVKPAGYPASGSVPMLQKGTNFVAELQDNGAVSNGAASSTEVLPLDEWTHVSIIYDGVQTVQTYFGDEKVAENTNVTPEQYATNSDALILGGGFEGQLDEIRIWNIARDPNEVTTDRKRRLLGNEDGLAGYYVLDEIAVDEEAIRDFTGLARGTTAENFAFVVNDAAPLDLGSIIQDVPAEVVRAGTREIVIQPKANFPTQFYEGIELIAFIKDNAIRGEYGNPAKGKTWKFRVNTNDVAWAQTGKTLFLEKDRTENVTFVMDLMNKSSNSVFYRIKSDNLPSWLTIVGDKEADRTYNLHGTHSGEPVIHTITFAIKPELVTGEEETVTAQVLDLNGAPIAHEQFRLQVNIPEGDGQAALPTMEIWAQVEINGEISGDVNDQVTAYNDEEVYGSGNVAAIDGKSLVTMRVFGTEKATNEGITFSVWDASQNKMYHSVAHPFKRGNYGSKANPVKLIFGEEGQADTGVSYTLKQNVPNPMHDQTKITYILPVDEENVTLEIRDIRGGATPLRTFTYTGQEAGEHTVEWDGTTEGGNRLAPGVYMYVLKTSSTVLTRKIIIQ